METTTQENAVGWRGWERMGERSLVLASDHGLLIPLHFNYKCIQALFINQYSSCLPQPPAEHHLELPITLWSGAIGPSVPVWEVLWFRWLLVEHLFFLSSLPEEGWSCSESILVLADYIWFLFLFFWITILPIPSCLPPFLPNMYNNYTETATNLYIVFGSNSMRRWGTIKSWDSCSPLLCKFKSGGWGRGIVKMFTKL